MRWLSVDNKNNNLRRGSAPCSSSHCWPKIRPIFVPTGLPLQHSIPRECCWGVCSTSTRTGPSTCLLVYPLHATISHSRNSAPYGGTCRNPSFSKTSISTRWRIVYPRCSFQSAMEGPGQVAWVVHSAYHSRKITGRQDCISARNILA